MYFVACNVVTRLQLCMYVYNIQCIHQQKMRQCQGYMAIMGFQISMWDFVGVPEGEVLCLVFSYSVFGYQV